VRSGSRPARGSPFNVARSAGSTAISVAQPDAITPRSVNRGHAELGVEEHGADGGAEGLDDIDLERRHGLRVGRAVLGGQHAAQRVALVQGDDRQRSIGAADGSQPGVMAWFGAASGIMLS
jgi:hypothetical protein